MVTGKKTQEGSQEAKVAPWSKQKAAAIETQEGEKIWSTELTLAQAPSDTEVFDTRPSSLNPECLAKHFTFQAPLEFVVPSGLSGGQRD